MGCCPSGSASSVVSLTRRTSPSISAVSSCRYYCLPNLLTLIWNRRLSSFLMSFANIERRREYFQGWNCICGKEPGIHSFPNAFFVFGSNRIDLYSVEPVKRFFFVLGFFFLISTLFDEASMPHTDSLSCFPLPFPTSRTAH